MKISIITATYNSAANISSCISSVNSQTHNNIEHIIIDGNSKDNTLEIINSLPNRVTKIISEPDNGIYDALNKGIKLATGYVIGFLHSDDLLANSTVIERIANSFDQKIKNTASFPQQSNIPLLSPIWGNGRVWPVGGQTKGAGGNASVRNAGGRQRGFKQ